MGMIQIDMEMPNDCLNCPACNEYLNCTIPINGRKWGENDVREFEQERPEWCPMKEQKKEIKLHKKYTFSLKRTDEFSMRRLYEIICETLMDEGRLVISRTDDHEKVDFVWEIKEADSD